VRNVNTLTFLSPDITANSFPFMIGKVSQTHWSRLTLIACIIYNVCKLGRDQDEKLPVITLIMMR
jgi:hypothetical protein